MTLGPTACYGSPQARSSIGEAGRCQGSETGGDHHHVDLIHVCPGRAAHRRLDRIPAVVRYIGFDEIMRLQWARPGGITRQDDIPLRGGSHRDSAWSLRSAYQASAHSYTVWETGFRPARTLLSTEAEFTRPALQLAIPVQVDPSLYDDYVGKYQIPGDIMLSITKHDGHLFIQVTGHPKYAHCNVGESILRQGSPR